MKERVLDHDNAKIRIGTLKKREYDDIIRILSVVGREDLIKSMRSGIISTTIPTKIIYTDEPCGRGQTEKPLP